MKLFSLKGVFLRKRKGRFVPPPYLDRSEDRKNMANDYKKFAKDYRTAFEEAKSFSLRGVFLPKDLPLRPPRYREHSEDFDNLHNDVQNVCDGFNKAFEEVRDKLEH